MKIFSKTDIQDQFGQSRLVTSINIPNLSKKINSLSFSKISYKKWDSFEKKIRVWLEPFINLDQFPYLYPTAGILGGLDYSIAKMNKSSQLFLSEGEFDYIKRISPETNNALDMYSRKYSDITKIYYITNPSSISGYYIEEFNHPCDEVWMDTAYLGTTFSIKKLFLHPKTTKIFFSLNKAFGIFSFRTGFLFSKDKDMLQELLLNKKYINNFGIRISDYILSNFQPLWLTEQYSKFYFNLMNKYELKPTDTILLAKSSSDAFFYWKKNHSNNFCVPTGYAINKEILNER